jgi:F-type H+-transporting ATPase subunit epsilon
MANDNALTLEIISPEGEVFNDHVDSVSMPSHKGEITVLPHHAPLFTRLEEGEVKIKQNSKSTTVVISGGFLEIKENVIHILSDYAVRAESIEIAKAEERKRLAHEKLRQRLDNREFTKVNKDLRLSIVELKVAQRVRHRQRVEE